MRAQELETSLSSTVRLKNGARGLTSHQDLVLTYDLALGYMAKFLSLASFTKNKWNQFPQ